MKDAIAKMKQTRLTKSDILILVVKINVALVVLIGLTFPFNLAVLYLLAWLVDYIICKLYNLEPLNSIDKNCFFDESQNRNNVMACLVIERATEASIREIFEKKLPASFKRFRCRMRKVLDNYYFEELCETRLAQ
jgi:hypothetical protein